jgi:hypothetical protein
LGKYVPIRLSPPLGALLAGLSLVLPASGFVRAAEPLQLTCEPLDQGSYRGPVKFRVDLDNRTVELLEPGGHAMASTADRKMDALTPSVRITDAAIAWRLANSVGVIFEGQIDRETGNSNALWFGPQGTYANAPNVIYTFQGRCRRAAPKF